MTAGFVLSLSLVTVTHPLQTAKPSFRDAPCSVWSICPREAPSAEKLPCRLSSPGTGRQLPHLLNPVQHLIHTDVVEVDQPCQLPVLDERTALWRCQVFQESLQVLVVLVDNGIWREQELGTESHSRDTLRSGNRRTLLPLFPEAPVLQEGRAVQQGKHCPAPVCPGKAVCQVSRDTCFGTAAPLC